MSCIAFFRTRTGIGLLVGGLAIGATANAHHSVAPFDRTRMEELEGEITSINWRNPHVTLTMNVTDESGRVAVWQLETDSANTALRSGLTPDSLRVGQHVRVAGRPSTRGRPELFVINVLADGVETVISTIDYPLRWTGGAGPRAAPAIDGSLGRSIFRVWASGALYKPRSEFVYTPAAQAARAAWDPITDMLALRCIPPGMPNANLNPYPIEFVDDGETIRLNIEEWEARRVIDMVSPEIPADAPRSRLGYSIGRWEGDTLVIETERIDFPYLDDEGTPMSDRARIVEQYRVSEDGSRLDYTISVTDPASLVGPAVWDAHWTWVPGTAIRPFECEAE